MRSTKIIQGIVCPMLTPFDEQGKIDVPTTRKLVDFLASHGIHWLLSAGTTGEGMLLSTDEKKLLAETVVKQADGRVKVLVHTGCITTAETVTLTCHAQTIGADGASIITPYFYSYDDDALFQHYMAVSKAVPDFPISLYSFPGNAKQEISINLFTRLRQAAPNIIAIKLSDVNLIRFQEYAQAGGDDFSPLCGVDALTLPALSVGACGQVSGNSNVFPEPFIRLYDAFAIGDLETARQQQVLINRIRAVLKDNIVYFKAAMKLRGLPVGAPRPPMRILTPKELSEMERDIYRLGIL